MNDIPPGSGWLRRLTIGHRPALVAILLFAVFHGWFGVRYHTVVELGSGVAENDGFVFRADKFRQGHVPRDGFRPLLYPLLAAGVGSMVDDTFVGGRTVSQLGTLLYLWFAYFTVYQCFGRRLGWLVLAACMLNFYTVRYGVHVATDMLFAGFALGCVSACIRAFPMRRWRGVAPVAAWFALACFTRYAAVALVPVAAIALGGSRIPGWKERAGRLALCAGLSFLFLVPHFCLTYKVFGNPFYERNIANVRQKVFGNRALGEAAAGKPMTRRVLENPTRPVTAAAPRLAKLARERMGRTISNEHGGLAVAYTVLMGIGLLLLCRRLNGPRFVWLSFAALYVAMIALALFTKRRMLLPVVPAAYALAFYPFTVPFPHAWMRGIRLSRGWVAVPIAILLVLQVSNWPALALEFVDNHPVEELEALMQLGEEYGDDVVILSTFAFAELYVDYGYHYLSHPRMSERGGNVARYYARLAGDLKRTRADFLYIGHKTRGAAPRQLAEGVPPVPYLVLERRTAVYTLLRVIDSEL